MQVDDSPGGATRSGSLVGSFEHDEDEFDSDFDEEMMNESGQDALCNTHKKYYLASTVQINPRELS